MDPSDIVGSGVPGGGDARVDALRLRRFLAFLVPTIFGFALVQTVAGVVVEDPRLVLVGACIGGYGSILLWARRELDRGRVARAAAIAAAGLVPPDIAILVLDPALVTTLNLVPLLAVSIALPFVASRVVRRLFVAAWLWTVGVVMLVEALPSQPDPVSWYGHLFRIAGAGAATGMILLLLSQYRDRLVEAAAAERAAADSMREVDALKTAFLDAVSHDLRSPTTTILGAARTLERAGSMSAPETDGLVTSITRQAEKLQHLLDDLLDLRRIEGGRIAIELRDEDLAEVVREVVHSLDVPPGRELKTELRPVVVPIDRIQIERIVENLVVNAFNYSPRDGQVWVRVLPAEGGAEIHVEDAGPGIPDGLREQVFEPFQRGDDTSDVPGTGIGLSLVARFAELHGGNVSVIEREGGGTSFRVFLPHRAAA